MDLRRVVVTGLGTINPLGTDVGEYFSNLQQGVSGAAPITHFDASHFKVRFACEIKNYDWTRYFDRKEVRKYDPFVQYALIAAAEAVADAGIDGETVDRGRCGVIWSSGVGGIETFFNECMDYAKGEEVPRFSPFFVPRMIAFLACIMAVTRGVIPPTINVEHLDGQIDPRLDLTLAKARHRDVRCALSNTFGFGGHNSTVIFRKLSVA